MSCNVKLFDQNKHVLKKQITKISMKSLTNINIMSVNPSIM